MILRQTLFNLLIITAVGCGESTPESKKTNQEQTANHFPNIIQVEQFGDSIRIEVEQRSDTIIKHYIDLKGTEGDHFDDSYNSICTYQKRLNDTMISSVHCFEVGDYRFYMDRKKVVAYCDSILKGLTSDVDLSAREHYTDLKKYLKPCQSHNMKQGNSKDTISLFIGSDSELLLNFNAKIEHIKTGKRPKLLLIEHYRTEFSRGKSFYIIKNNGDTVNLLHHTDFMN